MPDFLGGDGIFVEMVAERFRVLGEPMRLRMLKVLMEGEKTVGELVEATGATQANTSRHLQTLARVGILSRRKEGLCVYYRIVDETIPELCRLVCTGIQDWNQDRARASGG